MVVEHFFHMQKSHGPILSTIEKVLTIKAKHSTVKVRKRNGLLKEHIGVNLEIPNNWKYAYGLSYKEYRTAALSVSTSVKQMQLWLTSLQGFRH